MAQWQKIIVSGSDAILKTVTLDNGIAIGSQILSSSQAGTKLSGSFTGSFTGDGSGLTGVSAAGTVSSSAQIAALLPASSVSSSAQVTALLPASTVSSSIQIDYNSITNKLSGVVSSSAQIAPLLPASTVSSSAQVIAAMPGAISSSTQFQTLANPFTGSFTGSFVGSGASLTGLNIGSALNVDVYKFVGDASTTLFTVSSSYFVSSVFVSVDGLSLINTEDYSISGAGITFVTAPPSASNIVVRALINAQSSGTGSFTGSFKGDGSGLTGVSAAGTVSSSAQIAALLPASTVSSSTQFQTLANPFTGSFTGSFTGDGAGLTGIASTLATAGGAGTGTVALQSQTLTIAGGNGVTTSANAQTITVSAPAGTVSSSIQVDYNSITNKLSGVVSSSAQVAPLLPASTVSSSAQVTALLPASTVSSSTQFQTLSDPFTGSFTGSFTGVFPYGSLSSIPGGIVSSSAQVAPLLPGGSVSSSAQYPGWVTASSQIDYNSITNKLSGVVSSSAQVAPLLPAGTVSSSGQVTLSGITGTTFSTADFTFPQNLTVAGNLFVDGTTTTVNTANLNIEDRFILVNSGSVPGGNAQGGIIAMDNGANASGSAVFYSTENSINRWGLAENVASNATVVTQTAYVAAVVDMTVAAQSASLATYAKPGNIRVETNGDIHIYG